MTYRFARERLDYSDYATGRLLSGLPGRPAFPVRLADEVFQRCFAYSARHGTAKRLTLYDPCCGGAYLLTVLALLHWQKLEMIVGSDADGDVLPLASRNLSLLTIEGLRERIDKIETMHRLYGKESHATALESAKRLETRIRTLHGMHGVPTHLFQADALNSGDLRANLDRAVVDLVITDVPYGKRSAWIGTTSRDVQTRDPLWCLLESLSAVLARHAVIAVISDKSQRVVHERYARIDRFQVGTRRVEVLTC